MLSFIISKITEAEISGYFPGLLAAGWGLFAVLFLIPRANRFGRCLKAALISGLVVSVIFDIIWIGTFFDNFTYADPGFSGMIWLFLYPAAMMVMALILSYFNANRYAHDQKIAAKEAEKERKKQSARAKYESVPEAPADKQDPGK